MRIAAKDPRPSGCRRAVAVAVAAGVAAIHAFRVGSYLRGGAHRLYYSYASDVLLPFAMYFVLGLNDHRVPILGHWSAKALVVFAAASGAEVLQGFGVPMLGHTFDPVDFGMYAIGVLLAVVADRVMCPARSGGLHGST